MIRIGYVPLSAKLDHPGDIRRFCHYAAQRGLRYEIADPSRDYDVVVVTHGGDITTWSRYPKPARIIYDFIDSYLAESPWHPKSLLRGLAKFATRQTRRLSLDYRQAIREMCARANAVICSTEEQRGDIGAYCSNIHIILDIHTGVARARKADYVSRGPLKLAWEGVPEGVPAFGVISDVLADFSRERPVELHLVTRKHYWPYMGRYGLRKDTAEVARKLFPNVVLHPWTQETAASDITACDLAVVPIPLHEPLARGKPENRLLLLWRMGMPVLTSTTPAYRRTMAACGLPMACESSEDWLRALRHYGTDEGARRAAAEKGREFAETRYGEEVLMAKWDAVFASVREKATS